MRFAALGRTRWLFNAIEEAARRGHECVLIGTAPAAPEYDIKEQDFRVLAQTLGVPYFCNSSFDNEAMALIDTSGAEICLSVNWPVLISQSVIDKFPRGVVNAHAGDLPRFRGNACPNWAILAGESEVVVTLHAMTPELDAGAILLKEHCPITPSTYISDVYAFMDDHIPRMFADVLDGLANESLASMAQSADESLALRCLPRRPEDGLIDWSMDADAIHRLVRASAEPFTGAYTYLDLEPVIVWRARAEAPAYSIMGIPGHVAEVRIPSGEVAVLTGQGLLVLEEIEILGKRTRPAEAIPSCRLRLGLDRAAGIGRLQLRSGNSEHACDESDDSMKG